MKKLLLLSIILCCLCWNNDVDAVLVPSACETIFGQNLSNTLTKDELAKNGILKSDSVISCTINSNQPPTTNCSIPSLQCEWQAANGNYPGIISL